MSKRFWSYVSALPYLHPDDSFQPLYIPKLRQRTSVHRDIYIPSTDQSVCCLFDSGAESNNYANIIWVNQHRDELLPYLSSFDSNVTMADGMTIHPIREILTLDIIVTDPDGITYPGHVVFYVFPMGGNVNLCIGLPDIEAQFIEPMVKYLSEGSKIRRGNSDHTINAMWSHDELLYPYLTDPSPTDPTDYDDGITSEGWSDIANYLDIPRDEAIAEYKAKIGERFSIEGQEFDPAWRQLMESDSIISIFIPKSWKGLNLPPIELEWKDDVPDSYRDYMVQIPHQLRDVYTREMDRLKQHFYAPSTSRTVSAVVVAKKATKPYIRVCGNYVKMNNFIKQEQAWHPDPRLELERLVGFSFFDEVDIYNSYHQFPLGEKTRARLAILTPDGILEPLFLPEGVTPASAIEQRTYSTILAPISHRALVIHDNILLMGKTLEELQQVRRQLFDLCIKWNLKLKYTKCRFAVRRVEWFGFIVQQILAQ